jgi:hypothetical protein
VDPARIDGRYDVEAEIGRGGMGTVFRVLDTATGDLVALKRMHGADTDRSRPDRGALHFRREFHTLARLAHPHVVEVRDFGLDDGLPYYTMELLSRGDLRQVERATVRECCGWLRDVASALAFLHARRLLHRDLKSRNVRLCDDGRAKLIDFGVLATVGVAGDVAGTPSSIAPESIRGLPLDGRADLFGLGTLAYWLLTSHHAYPARTLDELPEVWAKRPAPPSELRRGVPEALDELVLAMLSIDATGRPRTAAEVIDRLSVIADLDEGPAIEVSQGWLASGDLVGRDAELVRVRALVKDTVAGRGDVLLFAAPAGTGKTRLLREAGLEAQLHGATVMRATGREGGGYDVVRQLVHALPEGARRAAAAEASSPLRRMFPELGPAAGAPSGDPAEERLRVQRGLTRWFRALAEEKPVVLLVDELQVVDEPSLAALAALARECSGRWRVGIVAARRTDEPVRAVAALEAFAGQADVAALRGLDEAGVQALVRSVFGEVPHAHTLAAWMNGAAGGSPLLCMELVHHLVDIGAIRYAEGTWLLPGTLEDASAPRALAEAMDRRVKALSPRARSLAEALAILDTTVSLELLAAVAEAEEAATFAAIDELIERELLVGEDAGFQFRHAGLREALLRALGPVERRALHLLAARALEATEHRPWAPATKAAIGWHWLRGGERKKGAPILEGAGRLQYAEQSFSDAIPSLEAALEVYEESELGSRRCVELRQMLMRAGVVSDRAIVMRYADDTIAVLTGQSGLQTARRWSRWLGRRLALLVGLAWAFAGWLLHPKRRFAPTDALARVIGLMSYAASVHSLAYDTERVRRLLAAMDPLQGARGRIPHGAYLIVENFLFIAQGNWQRLHDNVRTALKTLEEDKLTPLPEIDHRFGRGAVHYMQASVRALDQDAAFERNVAALEELDLRFFDAASHTARYIFHELRGERMEADANAERSRTYAVQLGNAWVFESQRAWISAIGCAAARDVVGLKRAADEIDRLVGQGYRIEGFGAFARGEYLRECGDPRAACEILQAAVEQAPRDQLMLRQLLAGALAEARLAAGEADRALKIASDGLALELEGELGLHTARMRLRLVAARAHAMRGEATTAAGELDALARDAERLGSPLWCATIDEARAELHAETGDPVKARLRRADACARLRATGNPVLMARAERLAMADVPSLPPQPSEDDEEETVALRPEEPDALTE